MAHVVPRERGRVAAGPAASPRLGAAGSSGKISLSSVKKQGKSKVSSHGQGGAGKTTMAAMLVNNETECHQFSFHGHMTSISDKGQREETQGSGHLGPAFIGVASVREGRGLIPRGMPALQHLV